MYGLPFRPKNLGDRVSGGHERNIPCLSAQITATGGHLVLPLVQSCPSFNHPTKWRRTSSAVHSDL